MDHLHIDWSQLPTYNTIMALFSGASLISVAHTGKKMLTGEVNPKGWSINFFVLGFVLTLTGAHMTLTWPLARYFPFDNIIFGEPVLALGVLNLVLSFLFWNKADEILHSIYPLQYICKLLSPLKIIFYGLGLMLISISIAGVNFEFFAAPKEEPVSGYFADYPWLEAWGLSSVFFGVGIAAFLSAYFITHYQKQTIQTSWIAMLNYRS
ncbi:DUF981 family protein [Apibacter raozihei]|uniref:DUF981 family protein n=1 Tax=Apibacter raozihei TaxID=2500547 RepID=UPI000FE41A1C|nr:DUF981 family protein [Apibacter raozihei]